MIPLNHWLRDDHPCAFISSDLANIGAVQHRGLMIVVAPEGICVNGSYGSNPSAEEMQEMLEVMRQCVAEWDAQYGDQLHE